MVLLNNKDLLIRLILIILLQSIKICVPEYFSSIHEMSTLVELEGKFLEVMQNFVAKNNNKLEFLKAQLAEFEQKRGEAILSGPAYFDSPINQYQMTKRLTVDWERVLNLMEYKTAEKSTKRLKNAFLEKNITNETELVGGIDGILNMQEAYRLKTKDIAAGDLQGIQYDKHIDAALCFDIGMRAFELKKYRQAHSWLMEALNRQANYNNELHIAENPEKVHILTALANAKTMLGDIKGANTTYAELIELKPESPALARAYMTFSMEYDGKNSTQIDYSEDHEPIPADTSKMSQRELWLLTCSGHFKKSPREQRYLRCGYLTETHPFLKIAPIKVEELNHDPLLVHYYDVLYDSEIEEMKKLTNHRVTRATVLGINGSVVSPIRTSQFLFLNKKNHKVLQKIDERVEHMTKLNMNHAEEHQFQNYGIGGLYAQHYDYFSKAKMETPNYARLGNRIATVLFYLTDVKQGGGTAYPYLKQVLMPRKGDAAFWYNLHASEEPDKRTLHGGCPVIVGSKWVLNRWIRSRHQDIHRPCEVFNDAVDFNINKVYL